MRLSPVLALAACILSAVGCRSAYIEATVTNDTPVPLQLIEVDYPSASFGTQNLASGGTFHYRFKILGNGATKLLYTDAAHQDHTSAGPSLNEGQEGALAIRIAADGPHWNFTAHVRP